MNKKNIKILVADNEQGVRDMMSFLLAQEGFEYKTAENGLQAIDILKKERFDIIFLDVHMPKMGGFETLDEIKKMYPDQIVIMFSSSSGPQDRLEETCKAKGVHSCLNKPFEIDELMQCINSAMKKEM